MCSDSTVCALPNVYEGSYMKRYTFNSILAPLLALVVSLAPSSRSRGANFTTLHGFAGVLSDGNAPNWLTLSGTTLYGTAADTVFSLATDGTGFTNLYTFNPLDFSRSPYTNSDGGGPSCLILSGDTLYGTAEIGGTGGNGTLFALGTDGTGLRILHTFSETPFYTNSDGASPSAGLVLSGNTLYGTANAGGPFGFPYGNGTVFAVNTDGTAFQTLHAFTGGNDGANPPGGLVLSGNTLYGTTSPGWPSNPYKSSGTVFAVNTDGSGFRTLHTFDFAWGTNSGGEIPSAGLILSDNTLFGTTAYGGSDGAGTVFALNTDGTGFRIIHTFTTVGRVGTNYDGYVPSGGLTLRDGMLYGSTREGGSSGGGTIFTLATNGNLFATLHAFTASSWSYLVNDYTNSDGGGPFGGVVVGGNMLYGTAFYDGPLGKGTVFSLIIPPRLGVCLTNGGLILSWSTNAIGFTLQSTTNLSPPVLWAPVSASPNATNGQYMVVVPTSGTPQFYRLVQ